MTSTSNATSTPSQTGPDFLDRAFALVDSMDIDAYLAMYTPDGRFTFGNAPAAEGKDAVRAGLEAFYGSIAGMSHAFVGKWWAEPEVGIVEAVVTYTRKDSSTISLPVTTIYRLRDGLAADVRVFMDVNPLFAAA